MINFKSLLSQILNIFYCKFQILIENFKFLLKIFNKFSFQISNIFCRKFSIKVALKNFLQNYTLIIHITQILRDREKVII